MKAYFTTSDQAHAAYLCVKGFTLLGAVDVGETDYKGYPRHRFYLTHADLKDTPEQLFQYAQESIEEYAIPFKRPTDLKPVSFKDMHIKLAMCRRAAHNPIPLTSIAKEDA